MRVTVDHRVDKSEQRADGLYDYYYEYDVFDFAIDDRVLRARAYRDSPKEVSFLGWYGADGERAVGRLIDPLPAEVLNYLKERGFTEVTALGPNGYGPIPSGLAGGAE